MKMHKKFNAKLHNFINILPSNNLINHCSMKCYNILLGKFSNILNNNINNIEIAFKLAKVSKFHTKNIFQK